MSEAAQKVRLDKWLWAARFFKTRGLAKEAIEGGKVHYNGQRTKPGKTVDVGAMVLVRQGWQEKLVEILVLSDKRQAASIAQSLYRETEESVLKREQLIEERRALRASQPVPFKRPSKRDRRRIHRFKDINSE